MCRERNRRISCRSDINNRIRLNNLEQIQHVAADRVFCIQNIRCINCNMVQAVEISIAEHWTYRVPHDNLSILAERIVQMLRHVQINEITEMVIHVYT